jgi:hypothetical protein
MSAFDILNFLDEKKQKAFKILVNRISLGRSLSSAELSTLDEFVSMSNVSVESDSTRLGYLVPLDKLSVWFNDQNLADYQELDDDEYESITDTSRIEFARDLLRNIGDSLDADIHPGLLAVNISAGDLRLTVGYAISGYSFSGIELTCIEVGKDDLDLIKRLSGDYLLIDDSFFILASVESAVKCIPDDLILKNWERH